MTRSQVRKIASGRGRPLVALGLVLFTALLLLAGLVSPGLGLPNQSPEISACADRVADVVTPAGARTKLKAHTACRSSLRTTIAPQSALTRSPFGLCDDGAQPAACRPIIAEDLRRTAQRRACAPRGPPGAINV